MSDTADAPRIALVEDEQVGQLGDGFPGHLVSVLCVVVGSTIAPGGGDSQAVPKCSNETTTMPMTPATVSKLRGP